MGKGGGTTVKQKQETTQKTDVTVQNVIEDRGLDPLEKVEKITNVITELDRVRIKEKEATGADTVLIQPEAPVLDEKTAAILALGFAGAILAVRVI